MRRKLKHLAVASVLCITPVVATAAMLEEQARATVQAMLDTGASASEIIEALVVDGRSLEDATVTAVVTTRGGAQLDLAEAGICAAADTTQAAAVGQAALQVVGGGYQADNIERFVAGYAAGDCRVAPPRRKAPPAGLRTGRSPSEASSAGGFSVSPSN